MSWCVHPCAERYRAGCSNYPRVKDRLPVCAGRTIRWRWNSARCQENKQRAPRLLRATPEKGLTRERESADACLERRVMSPRVPDSVIRVLTREVHRCRRPCAQRTCGVSEHRKDEAGHDRTSRSPVEVSWRKVGKNQAACLKGYPLRELSSHPSYRGRGEPWSLPRALD